MTPPSHSVSMVTEFFGHPRESQWERSYIEARNYVQESRSRAIYDLHDVRGDIAIRPTVRIRIVRSTDVGSKAISEQISNDCEEQKDDGQMGLGIFVFGPGASGSAEKIVPLLGPPDRMTRTVEDALTTIELTSKLVEFLLLVIDRRFPLEANANDARIDSETVLAKELRATVSGVREREVWGMP